MKISKGTIARTIILIVSLVNQVLTSTGHTILPFSDEEISQVVSLIFTTVSSIAAWWKNNSFTKDAIESDEIMNIKKGGFE